MKEKIIPYIRSAGVFIGAFGKWVGIAAVVGLIGGAANPVYYRKVMRYVQLKYHKRCLLKL